MSREQEKLEKVLKNVLLIATTNGHARAAERAISELKGHGGSPSLDFTEKHTGTVVDEQAGDGDKKEYYSPLMYACENGMINTVRILLQNGASPGYTSKEKGSPQLNAFHMACMNGHQEIVQELLDATSSFHEKGVHPKAARTPKYGWSPVMYAIKSGHLGIVQLLGVDPKAKTKKGGQNVLHIAAKGSEDKHLECLKWLCSQVESELLTTDKNGWNLLHHACAGGNVAAVRWLIEQVIALPDVQYMVQFLNQPTESKSGCTPLHVACQYQRLEVLKFLLHTEGVDCQACTKQGMTGLHYAAIHDSAEVAQLLIGKNCPLHIQDEEGNTALHIARKKCSFEVEDVLKEADSAANGRLSEITNKDGKTAADIKPGVVIPPEIKKRGKEKEYIRALRKGEARIPRCNLLILGQQEVGKTSLYRLITGRKFLPDLESTKGIDNNTVEVVDTRQVSIASWNEINEKQRKAKDEEAYLSGIANEVGPLTATKAMKPRKPPTEEELLLRIRDSVRKYVRSNDISSAPTSVKRQPAVFHVPAVSHAPAVSLGTPQGYRVKQAPEVAKQQPKPRLTEPAHQQRHKQVQRFRLPPPLPTHHTKVKHEGDEELIPSVSPAVAELEPPSDLSRRHHLSLGKKMRAGYQKLDPELYLNTFDFAGQHEYRPMHHCFITGRAVYLVVFNLQKVIPLGTEASEHSLEEIRYWLHSIQAHISQAYSNEKRVFLVGTHRSPKDEKDSHPISEDELTKISKKLYREFFAEDHHNRCVNLLCFVQGKERIFHAVENSCDKDDEREVSGAKLLQSELKRVTDSLDFLKNKYPIIWLRFEEQLLNLREKIQEQQSSQVVGYDEVLELASNCGLSDRVEKDDEGEEAFPESVKTAIEFFHDTGTIVDLTLLPTLFLIDAEVHQLKGLVLLDPKWLITVMRKVVELRHSSLKPFGKDLRDLDEKGIASIALLKECWKEFNIGSDQQSFQQLCLILQAFGLIYPIEEVKEEYEATALIHRSASVPAKMPQASTISHSPSVDAISQPSECFLVPCRLPIAADVKPLKGTTFFFDFQGFLPAEIFHRLICLMLNKSRSVRSNKRCVRQMFSSSCCYFPNVDDCQWRVELDTGDCLKVVVRPRNRTQKCEPISYLSRFHLEYLKEICQGSGLHGIVYDGGPRCPCDGCGKVVSAVVHDEDDIQSVVECDECSTEVDVNCLLDPKYLSRQDEDSTPLQPSGPQPKPLSDPPQYEDLMEEVAAALPKKWNEMAIKLGLQPHEIQNIEVIPNATAIRCYSEVFSFWKINTPKPYRWATIIEALRSALVGAPGLASSIERRIR